MEEIYYELAKTRMMLMEARIEQKMQALEARLFKKFCDTPRPSPIDYQRHSGIPPSHGWDCGAWLK